MKARLRYLVKNKIAGRYVMEVSTGVRHRIMKKLLISLKPPKDVLAEFKSALREARKGKLKGDYYEIAFDNKKDFDRFVKNMSILAVIFTQKPKSVYELAKLVEMDVSNLNKLMDFFAKIGAIKLQSSTIGGRAVKTPVVEYGQIEFDLKAAG